MSQVLMPKATAVWLVENSTLTFDQISAFTGLHPLEVQAIADGEVAGGMTGLDPTTNGQLTKEEIKRAEADPGVVRARDGALVRGDRALQHLRHGRLGVDFPERFADVCHEPVLVPVRTGSRAAAKGRDGNAGCRDHRVPARHPGVLHAADATRFPCLPPDGKIDALISIFRKGRGPAGSDAGVCDGSR